MSTYLELVNNVLNRLNEVELDSTTFASARGIHQAAKLGVRNAVNRINSVKWEWPFNYATSSQVLVPGTELYSFPVDYKIADWESFYLEQATIDDVEYQTSRLWPIQRQEWFKKYRGRDLDAGADGLRQPRLVFWYNNGQYGITPSPSKAWTLHYNYWKITPSLVNDSDTILIPENFNWVVEQGALEDMYMFLDNDQRAGLGNVTFKEAILQMATVLIPWNIGDFRSTVVNFGNQEYRAGYGHSYTPFI